MILDDAGVHFAVTGQGEQQSRFLVDFPYLVPERRKNLLGEGFVLVLPDGVARFDSFEKCQIAVRFITGLRSRQGKVRIGAVMLNNEHISEE